MSCAPPRPARAPVSGGVLAGRSAGRSARTSVLAPRNSSKIYLQINMRPQTWRGEHSHRHSVSCAVSPARTRTLTRTRHTPTHSSRHDHEHDTTKDIAQFARTDATRRAEIRPHHATRLLCRACDMGSTHWHYLPIPACVSQRVREEQGARRIDTAFCESGRALLPHRMLSPHVVRRSRVTHTVSTTPSPVRLARELGIQSHSGIVLTHATLRFPAQRLPLPPPSCALSPLPEQHASPSDTHVRACCVDRATCIAARHSKAAATSVWKLCATLQLAAAAGAAAVLRDLPFVALALAQLFRAFPLGPPT